MNEKNNYETKHERPWGHWRLLDRGPGFLVKAMLINGKQRISLQKHLHRSERWTVAMGVGIATLNGVKLELKPGDVLLIPRGATHRLANPAIEPLVMIEVQLGDDLREDDIVRVEDDYGRAVAVPLDGGVVTGKTAILGNEGGCELVVPLNEGRIVAGKPMAIIGADNPEVIITLNEALAAKVGEAIKRDDGKKNRKD